jgi:hypothetical protein
MLRFGNRGFEKRVTEVEWPFLMTEYLPAVASYIYSFLDTFAWFFDRTSVSSARDNDAASGKQDLR